LFDSLIEQSKEFKKNKNVKSAEILPWAQKFVAVSHGPERPIRRVLHLVPVGPERVNEADFAEALSRGANGAGSRLS
jgi:hypothetical protein